ncbi:MAG TPA: outer membrane lipoprotein-sorting protein [Acidobacteriaceae bacterium]|nr:outer membrane lipoprotein-sorting protein [Acidobacteriaceae bacterium]
MTTEQVAQMDAAAAKFQSVEADISVDRYTAIVQEHSTQKGTTAFQRKGGSMEMAMHLSAGSDDPETFVVYKNGEADVYYPSQKAETVISAGANRGEFDSMLTTGFGASSKDLAANWDVNFQGMETVDGVPCAKLDLVSKQQNVRNNFSHVTVWVDLARDVSLKVEMFQPDGDTRTATYTNIRYNKPVPEKTFTLKVPSGTQVTKR